MKKTLSILALVVIVMVMSTTSAMAVTNKELPQKLLSIGQKYGMTNADMVRIERYLSEYPVTEAQANEIVAKAEKAAEIVGNSEIKNLSNAKKDELKKVAIEAGKIADLDVKFDSKTASVYKNGKKIEGIKLADNGKLTYTGNETSIVLVVSSIAIIALASIIVVRKNKVNA